MPEPVESACAESSPQVPGPTLRYPLESRLAGGTRTVGNGQTPRATVFGDGGRMSGGRAESTLAKPALLELDEVIDRQIVGRLPLGGVAA